MIYFNLLTYKIDMTFLKRIIFRKFKRNDSLEMSKLSKCNLDSHLFIFYMFTGFSSFIDIFLRY